IEFSGGNNDPVTISNNGLDNGNNKILNVANGEVSATSKDAINGSQLFAELDQLNLRLTNLKNELSSQPSQPSQPSTPSQPFNLTVKGDNKEESVGNDRKLAFDNGKNTTAKITITKDNDVSVKFDLNEDIRDLNSMEFKSGIVINNEGLSMANKKITNLADGEVSATSKEGVNGSQLFATNEEVKKNKAQITIIKNDLNETKKQVAENKQDIENLENNFIELVDNATNINVDNWRNKLGIKDSERDGDFVEYTTNEDGSKVINLYDNNGEGTLITNVADGKIAPDSKDAVNGSQLYKLERNINNKIDYLDNKIDQVEKNVNGGIANAIAMGSIPQVWQNGKGLLGVGVGNSQGVNSVAVGYSQASDNGKMIFKLNASINTNKKANFGAGFGYQF
ncbi:YadA-like family protein, partial [uncultured Fusobacterium sp.]|uniref:YadA-like family protein n=1 Tax=uncultured Fusobacterium sp. TaxID=159267 RepID=UPI0025D1AC3A